jgi:hypothetical protein
MWDEPQAMETATAAQRGKLRIWKKDLRSLGRSLPALWRQSRVAVLVAAFMALALLIGALLHWTGWR